MSILGRRTAQVFSVALQPLLMPLYSVALLFLYTNFYQLYVGQVLRFLLPVCTFCFMLPYLLILFLWRLRYVSDFAFSKPSERIYPYTIFIVANSCLMYFYYSLGVYTWYLALIAAPGVIALVGLIINFYWKISAHMLAIGGLIGTMMSICFNVRAVNPVWLFVILFFLAGCLGVSRLYLRKSTPTQIYVGFVLGFVLGFATVLVGVYFFVPL